MTEDSAKEGDVELVELGSCKKSHGIKGGFQFFLYNTVDSVLQKGCEVILMPLSSQSSLPESGEVHKIDSIAFGNKIICYLKGISKRNEVDEMTPFSILYPRSLFPSTKEGEFYVTDMLSCEVIDEKGKKVGFIEEHYENGEQIVFIIRKENNELLELPFVKNFFLKVDVDKKVVTIQMPEEMP